MTFLINDILASAGKTLFAYVRQVNPDGSDGVVWNHASGQWSLQSGVPLTDDEERIPLTAKSVTGVEDTVYFGSTADLGTYTGRVVTKVVDDEGSVFQTIPSEVVEGVEFSMTMHELMTLIEALPNAAAIRTQVDDGLTAIDLQQVVPLAQALSNGQTVLSESLDGIPDLDGVESAVAAALSAIHLDKLFAAPFDPASEPGEGDALLNKLVENNGGKPRFTASALSLAPEGGSSGEGEDVEVSIRVIARHRSWKLRPSSLGGTAANIITVLPGFDEWLEMDFQRALNPGDGIRTISLAVDQAGEINIAASLPSADRQKVHVRFTGYTSGKESTVRVTAVTEAGRTIVGQGNLEVQ